MHRSLRFLFSATSLLCLGSVVLSVASADSSPAPAPAAPAAAAGTGRITAAPTLPEGVFAHWHSGKTMRKNDELNVIDVVGENHFSAWGSWFSVAKDGGFYFDGTQAEGVRVPKKQPVGNRFSLGVDICPDAQGTEHQTIAYLYRFCELRYRLSRQELSLNVWQTSMDDGAKEIIATATLPVPAGRWSRVQVRIEDKVAHLVVGDEKAEVKLQGTWEFLPESVVLLVGKGGSDRAYRGFLDHLHLALTP
ncbi:MAG: hypothetical protein H7067_16170 [Burkholderiales bacterium]|nr:hypothetical protein [Opitutaceae bacterium]